MRRPITLCLLLAWSFCSFIFFSIFVLVKNDDKEKPFTKREGCTLDELKKLELQLPANDCTNDRVAYRQKCIITKKTKCPEATWLEDYYNNDDYKKNDETKKNFTAIIVGCNKGFDAVHIMRMGSRNNAFSKHHWKKVYDEKFDYLEGVCQQEEKNDTILDKELEIPFFSSTYCIEPLGVNFHALNYTNTLLGWEKLGFHVVRAAMSKENSIMHVPKASLSNQEHDKMQVGIENKGLSSCASIKNMTQLNLLCDTVQVYNLSSFFQMNLLSSIQYLSIDVEGYDFDVILGANSFVLKKIEYIEFEYNWMGSWAKQSVIEAATFLEKYDFICYWAGVDKLWRINGCILDHYKFHYWSNVACVNERLLPDLAYNMENLFNQTLLDDSNIL